MEENTLHASIEKLGRSASFMRGIKLMQCWHCY